MKRFTQRLRNIERELRPAEPEFTKEELHVAKLSLMQALARSRRSEEIRNRSQELADRLAAEIHRTVVKHATDQFRQHIGSYVQPIREARWGDPRFLPPIVGSEYDDWELPNLYCRRLAVRHCAPVVALIGPPEQPWGPAPDPCTRWDLVFAHVLQTAKRRR